MDDLLQVFLTHQIIRLCGLPSINCLTRLAPPSLIRKAVDIFYGWSKESYMNKMNMQVCDMNDQVWSQSTLSLSLADFGFRDHNRVSLFSHWGEIARASGYI